MNKQMVMIGGVVVCVIAFTLLYPQKENTNQISEVAYNTSDPSSENKNFSLQNTTEGGT